VAENHQSLVLDYNVLFVFCINRTFCSGFPSFVLTTKLAEQNNENVCSPLVAILFSSIGLAAVFFYPFVCYQAILKYRHD
jgi:phosphotransferase system  glucose/maltose/N-acetylglucosamine-specific IIC component